MDKNAIKKYAVWARNELIARVTQKAEQYEITEDKMTPANADSIGGRLLSEAEKKQRAALVEKIKEDGFEQVMEEVAYTWFNRFTALRFMEVNNYLPSHTRVFTNEAGEFKPQILTDAIQLDLEGLNMDKVFELKDANKTEELYKYLLIIQCNALSSVLPRMFQKIAHYTELLLPDYLLREGSVIEQMIALIPEEDWTDQVQIIGWLYQYYNSEPKDAVFASLKKNVKISKENVPAATQLFTPDWIVRYMVENSLGRLWLEGHPNDVLKSEWKYYLNEAEQESDVQKQLDEIRKEYAELKPEEIRCIDPCMGSGHILCYMFDVLVKLYEDYGYTSREAVGNIVEKNLWGLDIDERAAQLSYFAVMMKARQYDRRFFTREIQPHVYAIEESNGITSAPMHDMGIELSQEEYGEAVKQAMRLVEETNDAKEYGSIIHITQCDWKLLRRFAIPRGISEGQLRLDIHGEIEAAERLQKLIDIGETLSQKYHVVITNPPYMGSDSMNAKLKNYVTKKYNDLRYDLYAVFIERCMELKMKNGFVSMITQNSFLFALCFDRLRQDMLGKSNFVNAIHLGPRAFEEISGEVVQTIASVFTDKIPNRKSRFIRLVEFTEDKEKHFFEEVPYDIDCAFFGLLPNNVYAYSISDNMKRLCLEEHKIGDSFVSKAGIVTGNDDYFLRYWQEVDFTELDFSAVDTSSKYVPFSKGGSFVKWYGNIIYAIKLKDLWTDSKVNKSVRRGDQTAYFKRCIGWSYMGGGNKKNFSLLEHCTCGTGTPTILSNDEDEFYYTLGFLNTRIPQKFIELFNPTLNTYASDICNLPMVEADDSTIKEVVSIVKNCISIAKDDWDAYESSWDFKKHPLIGHGKLSDLFDEWDKLCDERYNRMLENERRLNDIFLNVYGLNDELKEKVEEVSVHKADLTTDIKSLISYAVGCMFGRYSLDKEGIVFAGGMYDDSNYKIFPADKDNVIPICDDEYFADDIVGLFIKFVKCVYGEVYLEENLRYIADAIGGNGSARDVIRDYFLNKFYQDHVKNYQKKPIYWMFDAGKKNGFKCLIYMHRYRSDLIARVRTDYVHEQQSRYRTAISELSTRIESSASSERVSLSKRLKTLQDQAEEIRLFEEKVHHLADQMISIDIDNGIKNNYALFKDVLAKV